MDAGLPATCFTHDTQAYDSLTSYTATERGPPVAGIGASVSAVQPSIDSRSRCSLAPSPAAAAFVVYHYDYRAKPSQGATDSASTAAPQSGSARDLSSLQHSGVAANSGEKWAYRGVGRNHPGYDDALKGRVNPRNPNGTATPAQHNLGNTTDSPFTSWTRDPATARRFAGEDGVVLRVPRGEGSPYKFDWSPDVYYEQEILIRGPVCGALIC